ncbi:MAG TPA: Arf family protein [Candidatus Lokiarchaeia archaeon]
MWMLILCHIDKYYLPQVFLKVPKSLDVKYLKEIPNLIVKSESKFLISDIRGIKSANLIFKIPNKYSINKKDTLLVSILVTDGEIDVNKSQKLLEKFANKIVEIEDAYKGFYVNSDEYDGDLVKYELIKNIFTTFYKNYSENNFIRERDAKIFIYGLSKVGKTTIVKILQNSYLTNTLPTTNVEVSKINVNNISIITFDAPGQSKFRELWNPFLKNQDGLVYVLDITNKEQINEAKEVLHNVAMHENLRGLPLLILFNKSDVEEPDIEEIKRLLCLDKLGDRPMKYFLTSAITRENIKEAFDWLSLKMLGRIRKP